MDNISLKIVDIVIMTYKPTYKFVLLIDSLLKQNYNINKIYIINTDENELFSNLSESEKNKCQVLLNNSKICLININKDDFDHGASRNIVINYSNAEYIVFFTNDVVPYDKHLIERLVYGIDKDNSIKASYARQIPYKDASLKEKLIREFNYPDYSIIKSLETNNIYGIKNYFMSNVCAIYDMEYFKKNNGFIENIILNEDTYYAYNVINNGYKVYYNSDAKVYHSHNYNYIKQFKRYFDIGVSHNQDSIILKNVAPSKEGFKLFKYVLYNMFIKFKIISIIDFIIDTIFRFSGYVLGKNYKILSNNMCLKFTMNKNYFLRNNH